MRSPSRPVRRSITIGLALVVGFAVIVGGCALVARTDLSPTRAGALDGVAASVQAPAPTSTSTSTSTTSTTTAPVAPAPAPAPARTFATGNAQLDALLTTLPALLFEGGATVHYGWNPLDTCCHAGGYNPAPNEVWVGPSAFSSPARLTYVATHELAHSLHLTTSRGPALTAAVAGAPSVRPGPWDESEKVADCVAWALYPAETAASGITYWSCPDPWRSQVRAALQ